MDSFPKSDVHVPTADSTESIEQRLSLFIKQVSGRALIMMEAATGHHDVARDLVQESFIALHQHYAKRPTSEWTPLFYTILNNRLMDWRRQETRKQKRFAWLRPSIVEDDQELDSSLLIEDEQNINPAEFLNQEFTLQEIQKAISRLPLRQQQAFMLRAWENMDTKTTASIMDCSEGSVKTHYHRAIQTLRLHLSQFNPE
ncbi:RNA polymerase sigma factor [Alkanindiges hydrocarboniclasticus]|uniref:RNA polymerase sigma factor n=2 Tax=Alkanindiges hydrocarboniclasticus TaxID=1907941 RepID=A0A1S8CWE5_9GAMM|nr:RNA polymerase sigma factor [Alkanindiges hydrocarboniclasticus]ONG41641.1 RNA polymerase sigma factor [Alkanindiges hydrocarboniclasticus]